MRLALALLTMALFIAGCGGGGGFGGGGATGQVVGRVLSVDTGGLLNPAATVQSGSNSATTSLADGSFVLTASEGATTLIVDSNGAEGVWTFTIPSVSGTIDVGDLWVGTERVELAGRVIDSTTSLPVSGATVSFGGRIGTTNAAGEFSLIDVAYSSATQTAFWGIVGTIRATDYFKADFSASPNVAVAGTVDVGDILITPLSDDTPPPVPHNITGRVLPIADAPGTLVTLRDSGGTAIRSFNVGTNGTYAFWVAPGSYTVEYVKGALTAPTQNVTVDTTDDVAQVPDVTLG